MMAAVRLDPIAPVSPNCSIHRDQDTDSADSEVEDTEVAAPTRERVLSDEGRKLFLAGHEAQNSEYRPPDMGMPKSQSRTAKQEITPLEPEVDQDTRYTWEQEAPCGSQSGAQETSGFSFMSDSQTISHDEDAPDGRTTSAFGFLQETSTPNVKDARSATTPGHEGLEEGDSPSPAEGSRYRRPPPLPVALPDELLTDTQKLDDDLFEEMWHSTCELYALKLMIA